LFKPCFQLADDNSFLIIIQYYGSVTASAVDVE